MPHRDSITHVRFMYIIRHTGTPLHMLHMRLYIRGECDMMRHVPRAGSGPHGSPSHCKKPMLPGGHFACILMLLRTRVYGITVRQRERVIATMESACEDKKVRAPCSMVSQYLTMVRRRARTYGSNHSASHTTSWQGKP
jgi:hypothetical protein